MSLTHRQREVVELLCRGLNTKQIACRLGIVPAVVSNHLAAIRKANGLHNSAQIGIRAVLDGDIALDWQQPGSCAAAACRIDERLQSRNTRRS
jgi:DNA-binding CsgD family transcriptional regulator